MSEFKALMTAIYPVADVAAAKAWYAQAFQVQPYFDEPFYVGFDVAGFELGLTPAAGDIDQPAHQGVTAYWGTDDPAATVARLVSLGATVLHPLKDVGGDILVAVLGDPFGNAIGVIRNPHFKR